MTKLIDFNFVMFTEADGFTGNFPSSPEAFRETLSLAFLLLRCNLLGSFYVAMTCSFKQKNVCKNFTFFP